MDMTEYQRVMEHVCGLEKWNEVTRLMVHCAFLVVGECIFCSFVYLKMEVMQNILVTGANGQLGSELRAIAVRRGAEIADIREADAQSAGSDASAASACDGVDVVCSGSVVDGMRGEGGVKCSAGERKAIALQRYYFTDVVELDITDAEAVERFIREKGIDVVINCAAFTNVDRAEDDEVLADKLNHLAVRNLAEACKAVGAFLVHISTDYVFDGQGCVPYAEGAEPRPTGAYGRTKLAGERSVQESGCDFIIIRTAWLYSAYGNNFVKTMRRLTAEKPVVKVVFDQCGTPTYAGDLAAAIDMIVSCSDYAANQGIYHFSNEGVCSWYDFAIAIRDASGNSGCDIQPCHSDEFPSKVKRPSYSVLDKTKIKETFSVEIPHWRESLLRLIRSL